MSVDRRPAVPRILRLQPEIGGMFADNMDMLSLIRWRLTCKTNYDQTVATLRRSLLTMLNAFVPKPVVILNIITQHRSVIGGEFALAFILRDPSIVSSHLDIYSTDYEFNALCSSILDDPTLQKVTVQHEYTELGVIEALRTLVSRVLVVNTSLGTTIRLHCSYTSSATAPLSHASSTALSNFVTAYGFGCSHPALTLKRRALIADQELPHLPISDPTVHDHLIAHGFSIAFSPTAWTEYRRPTSSWNHSIRQDLPTARDAAIGNVPVRSIAVPRNVADHRFIQDGESISQSEGWQHLLQDGGALVDERESILGSGFADGDGPVNRDGSSICRQLSVGVGVDLLDTERVGSCARTPQSGAITHPSSDHAPPVVSSAIPQPEGPYDRGLFVDRGRSSDPEPGICHQPPTSVRPGPDTIASAQDLIFPISTETSLCFSTDGSSGSTSLLDSPGALMLHGRRDTAASPEASLQQAESRDHAASKSAKSTFAAVAPTHGVSASVCSGSARSDDYGAVVGRGMYRYIGTGDILSPHMPVDEDPIAHLERSLYMGEFGYTHPVVPDGNQDGEAVSPGRETSTEARRSRCAAVDDCVDQGGSLSTSPYALSLTELLVEPANLENVSDYAGGRFTSCPVSNTRDEQSADSALYPVGTADVFPVQDTLSSIVVPALDASLCSTTATFDHSTNSFNGIFPSEETELDIANDCDLHHDSPLEADDGAGRDPSGDTDTVSQSESDYDGIDTETSEYFFKPEECWRERYLCPSQGRFFGDRGSFMDFFDPLRGGEEYCAQNNVAPFGPMVIWRVLSTFSCEGGCDIYDDAINAGVPPIPVMIRRNPFATH